MSHICEVKCGQSIFRGSGASAQGAHLRTKYLGNVGFPNPIFGPYMNCTPIIGVLPPPLNIVGQSQSMSRNMSKLDSKNFSMIFRAVASGWASYTGF